MWGIPKNLGNFHDDGIFLFGPKGAEKMEIKDFNKFKGFVL